MSARPMPHGSRMTEREGRPVTIRTVREGCTLTLHGVLVRDDEGYLLQLSSTRVRVLADDVVTVREIRAADR